MRNIFVSFLVAGLLAMMAVRANADTVHLYSGASIEGTYDDNIHMLTGPIDGTLTNDFGDPVTFAASVSGPSAYIVTPHSAWAQFGYYASDAPWWDWEAYFNGDYGSTNPDDFIATSPARWVSSDPNGGAGGAPTALYSYNFVLPDITSASLDIQFATDQTLGTTADDGMFLNGIALAGSGGGDYGDILDFNFGDVTSLLHSGTNTLYLYNANYGGPAGILFDANLDYTPGPVPEPTTAALFGFSAVCGLILSRRRF